MGSEEALGKWFGTSLEGILITTRFRRSDMDYVSWRSLGGGRTT